MKGKCREQGKRQCELGRNSRGVQIHQHVAPHPAGEVAVVLADRDELRDAGDQTLYVRQNPSHNDCLHCVHPLRFGWAHGTHLSSVGRHICCALVSLLDMVWDGISNDGLNYPTQTSCIMNKPSIKNGRAGGGSRVRCT